ncbi:hypothetical protein F0A17_00455 [Billgrantia pellis]|uniref:Uncharacterized protein n=1 Tax=Billgrantia pellis TaxID=2606936 RepID=A0A7V7KHW8_9GAMM|nr:hypothetical protein F0A17_00455 [Halomonas pellis]
MLLGLVALVLASCTTRAVYEGIKQNHLNECNQLPGAQREECLDHLPPDYETYRRQHEAITSDSP